MDESKFPICVLVHFHSPKIPIEFIQNNIAQLLLSVQTSMITPTETIEVRSPVLRGIEFLRDMEDVQVEFNFTKDPTVLLNDDVEICNVYTDRPEYADEVVKVCQQHNVYCNVHAFYEGAPAPYRPSRKVPNRPKVVDVQTRILEQERDVVRRKAKSTKLKEAPLRPYTVKVKNVEEPKEGISENRKLLPVSGVIRVDGVFERYHTLQKKRKVAEEHASEVENLKSNIQGLHAKTADISDPKKRALHEENISKLSEDIKDKEQVHTDLKDDITNFTRRLLNIHDSTRYPVSSLISHMMSDDDRGVRNEVGFVTTRQVGSAYKVNLYRGVYPGQNEPITAFEAHKLMKHGTGGPSDRWIEDYANLVVNRVTNDRNYAVPDQIVVPPVTWTDEDKGKWGSAEEKCNALIHVRVGKRVAELLKDHVLVDKKTGQRISENDLKQRVQNGENIHETIERRSPSFDPMLLGTKDFEVKKLGSRKAADKRRVKVLNSYTDDLFGKIDRGELDEKFGQRVLLLDDNIDTGVTQNVLQEVIEGLSSGTKVDKLALFNMSVRSPSEKLDKETGQKSPKRLKWEKAIKKEADRVDVDSAESEERYAEVGKKIGREGWHAYDKNIKK